MYCPCCKKWFTKCPYQREHYTQKDVQMVQDHLDGLSLRRLVERYGSNRQDLGKRITKIIGSFKTCGRITKELVVANSYQGILVFDGKFVPCKKDTMIPHDGVLPRSKKRRKIQHGMVWMPYTDYHTHDIPVFIAASSENTYDARLGFKALKELRYPLVSVTCDKSLRLIAAVLAEYPNALIQYCIRHYIVDIQRKLKILNYRRTIKGIANKIDEINYDGHAFIRLSSRSRVVRLVNQMLGLINQYEIINDFYETAIAMLSAKDIRQRNSKRRYLEEIFFKKYFQLEPSKTYRARILKIYQQMRKDKHHLFIHLQHPKLGIPSTTNLNEGYNSQLENRIFSIRGFESIATCACYGNALILKRRFQRFTDCKGKFKHCNGKSPLELAGVDTSKLKNWIRFSIKKTASEK